MPYDAAWVVGLRRRIGRLDALSRTPPRPPAPEPRGTAQGHEGAMVQKLVLVVDDDEDNRVILQAILEHAGFAVLLAADGAEAVEQARAHRPAVVLMDLAMPVMNGWDATRRLKDDRSTAGIPVIAFTADDGASLPRRLRQTGFCAYLRKPYPPGQVLEAVRTCLEETASEASWIDLPSAEMGPRFSR